MCLNNIDEPSLVAQLVKNPPAMQEMEVQSLDREDLLEKEMAPTVVFLPEQSHGQEPRGLQFLGLQKSQTQPSE